MLTVVMCRSPSWAMTSLMKSKSPLAAPPVVTTKSWLGTASRTADARASKVSSTMGKMSAMPPASRASAAIA
jgi:hypothetical protein